MLQKMVKGEEKQCGDLNKNSPHKLICLNDCSPISRTV